MPDGRPPEEAGEWLRYAADDLEAAELLLTGSRPKLRQALFAAQQPAEKALKAFLIHRGQAYPLTHNLLLLGDVCSTLDGSLEEVIESVLPLTDFAVPFRYPGTTLEEIEIADSRRWVTAARQLLEAVTARICA